jgi:hypothetical protein
MGKRRAVDDTQQSGVWPSRLYYVTALLKRWGAEQLFAEREARGKAAQSTRPTWAPVHGVARRAEQIELNRSSCAEVYARDLVPLRVHCATTELTLAGGTEGSNHSLSSGESGELPYCNAGWLAV